MVKAQEASVHRGFGDSFKLPVKRAIIWVRWPAIVICSYLLVSSGRTTLPSAAIQAFIFLYVSTNIGLYFLDEEQFRRPYFLPLLVFFDTLVLTLSLLVNGEVGTDFYLAFFLLIIVSSFFEDFRVLAVFMFAAPLAYGSLLYLSATPYHASVYLRLPFLFITCLFYGYFAQHMRIERRLREEAERKIHSQMEVLGIVSHELKTPLSIIIGFAQLLRDKTLEKIAHEKERAVEKILTSADQLLDMIHNILDTIRVDAGSISSSGEEIDLRDFLEELRRKYERVLDRAKPVVLSWDCPSQLPPITSDRAKLGVILENLINNAIKFTDEGQITVSARFDAEQKMVEFKVSDTGIGIPEDVLPAIFEKFRQLDDPSAKSQSGVGLGLYIVKSFTELLGGKVTVQSELRKGSVFAVRLPAK